MITWLTYRQIRRTAKTLVVTAYLFLANHADAGEKQDEAAKRLSETGSLPSVAEQMGVESLGPPSEPEIFSAFAAYRDSKNKKIMFRTPLDRPKRYLLYNLSPWVADEMKQKLVSDSPCGRRAFEVITSYIPKEQTAKDGERRVGLLWECGGGCFAVVEKVAKSSQNNTKKTTGLSPTVAISQEFCSAIWGGILPLEDRLEAKSID